jgi:putative FmdB family regulatory protein
MPLYSYECRECGKEQEIFWTIAGRVNEVDCPCGGKARRVLAIGGVIGDDMPAWMRHPEALGCLQCAGDKKKITTRSEYNKYLKERGISEYSPTRQI